MYRTASGVTTLEAIYHAEGRIATINSALRYEYALKDHLGNTRIMYCDKNGDGIITQSSVQESNEVTQENHYYPYGLGIEGNWVNTPSVSDSKYQYNGKELNDDFGLGLMDYGARFYDAAVGQWTTFDPLAETMRKYSPYNYAFDNPMRFIDPDGMSPETVKPTGNTQEERDQALRMIKNTLTKEDQQYVTLDANGNIDKDKLNQLESSSENLQSLKEMVNSEIMIEVLLADKYNYADKDGNIKESDMPYVEPEEDANRDINSMNGLTTGESGFMGKTLFPDRKGLQNSPDNTMKIIVNKKLSEAGQAQVYSHEANGHGYIYSATGGDREKASHTVDENLREQNTELKSRIIRSKQETYKNMNQN